MNQRWEGDRVARAWGRLEQDAEENRRRFITPDPGNIHGYKRDPKRTNAPGWQAPIRAVLSAQNHVLVAIPAYAYDTLIVVGHMVGPAVTGWELKFGPGYGADLGIPETNGVHVWHNATELMPEGFATALFDDVPWFLASVNDLYNTGGGFGSAPHAAVTRLEVPLTEAPLLVNGMVAAGWVGGEGLVVRVWFMNVRHEGGE